MIPTVSCLVFFPALPLSRGSWGHFSDKVLAFKSFAHDLFLAVVPETWWKMSVHLGQWPEARVALGTVQSGLCPQPPFLAVTLGVKGPSQNGS